MKAFFFTNEKLASFLATDHFANVNHVFGIGGGGDFAFNLLAFHAPKHIHLCDNHLAAILAIQKKMNLFTRLTHQDFLDFLLSQELKRINGSDQYYPDSFKAIKQIHDYLPYLSSSEHYRTVQSRMSCIKMTQGDFTTELSKQHEPFDLIYLSNLLETKHCDPAAVLTACRSRLTEQGRILFASQDSPKIVDRLMGENLFRRHAAEIHKFSTLQNILGHYSYSFYLYKPIHPHLPT
ncbi:MAG: methyltransferase domain-containing protein [Patescibacteria group bacterium]